MILALENLAKNAILASPVNRARLDKFWIGAVCSGENGIRVEYCPTTKRVTLFRVEETDIKWELTGTVHIGAADNAA